MKTLTMVLIICIAAQASNVQLYENRPYTQEEIEDLTWFELCILRNEIYAIHGYVFSNESLAAYFEDQDWYVPDPDFTTPDEFDPGFSDEEVNNIYLFLEAAEDTEESVLGCCYPDNLQNMQVDYYRRLSFRPELPPVPDWYNMYTGIPMELGGYPDFSGEDILPYEVFNYLYTGWGHNETNEQWQATQDILDEYEVQNKAVYRLYFRSDRTVAKVEKVTLDFLDASRSYDPYVLWTAWFSPNQEFIIVFPDCKMNWAAGDLALIYTNDGDECFLRAAFKGTYPTIRLEIYDGPYSDLPLSIKISSEEIGGDERYEEFFTR
ncbi:MAG: YARHG domain-containing protein [Candidatus Aegiribacteria sp.]|nr:YARHG domain-containing protein [Candidatus Aegiribacteria sp.]